MVQVKIKDRYYELPMGDLYERRFSNYIHDGVIDLSGLDLEEKYKKIDELFGFVARSFVVVYGDMAEENEDMYHGAEIADICRRFDSIDRRQKFNYEKGNVERSIQIIESFIEEILILRNMIFDEEKAMKVG